MIVYDCPLEPSSGSDLQLIFTSSKVKNHMMLLKTTPIIMFKAIMFLLEFQC